MSDYVSFYAPPQPADKGLAPPPPPPPPLYPPPSADDQFKSLAGGAPGEDDDGATLGRIFAASRDATAYDGVAQGRLNALHDAAAARIKTIASGTGAALDNPYLRPPATGNELDDPTAAPLDREAVARYARETPAWSPGQLIDRAGQQRIDQLRLDAFHDQLAGTAAKFPDRADMIGADTPLEPEAQALANQATTDLGAAKAGAKGVVAPFLAQLAGGVVGGFRDPLAALGMVAGGGEGLLAKSVLGRIFEAAARQGAINAGITALAEPQVQSWRAQRGAETGVLPAAEDIGWASLFGALPGGVIEAAKIGLRGAPHVPAATLAAHVEKAASGDASAAAALSDAMPGEKPFAAAVDAAGLDAAAPPPKPAGLPAEDAAGLYRAAVRRAEDPDAALPELPRVMPSDELAAAVRAGRADPAVAREVAARVAPAEQGSVLAEIAADRPANAAQAAVAVSGALDARALPAAQALALGGDQALDRVPATSETVPRGTEAKRAAQTAALEAELAPEPAAGEGGGEQPAPAPKRTRKASNPQSLVAFLRAAGGIADDGGELAARDIRRRYPGLLNNRAGMKLDAAREMAAEAGYLGGDTERAMAETTVDDLLQAIDRHPVYSVRDLDRVLDKTAKAEERETLARVAEAADHIRAEAEAAGLGDLDPEFVHDAARLVVHDGLDWEDALDRAALQSADREPAARESGDAIPFDDLPPDGGGLPSEGGGDDGRGGAGLSEPGRGAPRPARDAGGQEVLPGAERIGDGELAQRRSDRGLSAKAAQELDTSGLPLFGDQAKQMDLLDMVPVGDRADGLDARIVPRDALLAAEPRETFLADLVDACKL